MLVGGLLEFFVAHTAVNHSLSLSFLMPVGQNGYCHSNTSELVAKLSHYVNVTSGNTTALKAAIYKQGPVAVSIDAAHRTFSFYSSGVYYEPKCGES